MLPTVPLFAPAGWRAYCVPGLMLAFSLMLLLGLNYYPKASQPVVVFFLPGTTKIQTLDAAIGSGANIVAAGAFASSLIVQSESPDFFSRLHKAGAWLIVDATGKSGCLSSEISRGKS